MAKGALNKWLNESEDNARVFAQEGLILEATEAICAVMEKKGVTRAELASAIGRTKAYVTQLLSGSRNMTLRTFADIAFALGTTPKIKLRDPLPLDHWEPGGEAMFVVRPGPSSVDVTANSGRWEKGDSIGSEEVA